MTNFPDYSKIPCQNLKKNNEKNQGTVTILLDGYTLA